jgi:predicted phosphodiesterase
MKIGVVTDAHLASTGEPVAAFHNPYDFANARRNLERALDRHHAVGVDTIAMLGDLAHAGDDASHALGFMLLETGGIPVWIVPGNHDTDEEIFALADRISARTGTPVRALDETGETVEGLRVAGLPIRAVDPVDRWTPALPDVAAWGDEPALLLTHFALISRERVALDAGFKYAGDVVNQPEIAAALQGRTAPTVVLHGHHHVRDAAVAGPVLQIGCAALIEPPHETALVEIELHDREMAVRVEHTAVAPSSVAHLPVIAPPTGAWRFAQGRWETIA